MLLRPCLFLLTASLMLSWEASNAAGSNKERGAHVTPQTEPGKAIMFERKKVTEPDGREFWVVRFENATYRIPGEYVANVPSSGVAMSMHWPTARGPRVVPSLGVKWDPDDVVRIFLSPPSALSGAPVRDSYESFKSSLARHKKRPSVQYPGLIEYFSMSEKTGNATVHYYVSADETIRTPSGNPYLCDVLDPTDAPRVRCSTFIRLSEGSRLRIILLPSKHLRDWQRIYPTVLKLIESSRSN